MMSKTVKIKVTSAFVYEGKIRTKGKVISMPEADAKSILEREKAVLAKGGDDAKDGKGADAGANGGKGANAGANAKKD
jgi:hypothetical protein